MLNNHTITINVENLSDEEREQLVNLLEKANANNKKRKAWRPKYREIYYAIDGFLTNPVCDYSYDNTETDDILYEIGNCFKTREEAEFEFERLKILARMKRFAEEHNDGIDWNDCRVKKFRIEYNVFSKDVVLCSCMLGKTNDIYFSSKEIAEACVKEIGEDNIKKYYLCIRE